MIEIAEILGPHPTPLWNLVKQVGVRHAVGVLPFGESGGEAPWDYAPLLRMKQHFEQAGFTLAAIESRPPLDRTKRGLEGRDEEIATVCTLIENMGRLGIPVWCSPSPVNGITLCQGNFALMTGDLPATIRHFGRQDKIFFVHLRDVRGAPERFVETFHDEGQTDLLACLRAYRDIGFAGVLRPDHVPTMEGKNNDHPGYAAIGRLFAIGYIKGLRQAAYAERLEIGD